MRKLERPVEAVHAAVLAVWFAGLVGAGLAAAVAFPQLKHLDARVPDFAAYPGEHWLIAGGHIGRVVFAVADRVQLGCSAAAVLTLAAATRGGWLSGAWAALRWAPLAAAAGLAVYFGLVLLPRMDHNVGAFWDAARAGDAAKAAQFRAAFDADHPTSSRTLQASAVCVLLSLTAAAASRRPA